MDKVIIIKTENDLKQILATQYLNQINNFFEDKDQALKFLSSVMAAVQRTPKLLECTGETLINSFMIMAQLKLMPSGVSGEAYVLPYKKGNVMEAQFQLGYQGLITLFYRAGGQRVRAEIVRENDSFSYENGIIKHSVDIRKSREERGEAIAAYAIATVNNEEIALAMNKTDIIGFGQRFSKSFKSEFTPWKDDNDPENWMWKKTVLKQLGKLLPKNETINRAIAEDNKDSVMHDRIEVARTESEGLRMGNMILPPAPSTTPPPPIQTAEEGIVYEPVAEEPTAPIADKKPRSAAGAAMLAGMKGEAPAPTPPPQKECHSCAGPISDPEEVYSMKSWGKPMCRKCQPKK